MKHRGTEAEARERRRQALKMSRTGMTQTAIAEALGVTQKAVSMYLRRPATRRSAAVRRGNARCAACGGKPTAIDRDTIRDLMLIGFDAGADYVADPADICIVEGVPAWSIASWLNQQPGKCRDCECGEVNPVEITLLSSMLGVYCA